MIRKMADLGLDLTGSRSLRQYATMKSVAVKDTADLFFGIDTFAVYDVAHY